MKRSNKEETIVHYIPEFYNAYINEKTGKEYGWIPVEYFKKPYTSFKWAIEAIEYSRRYEKGDNRRKYRLRIETFKCVDVKFEEV